MEEGWTDEEIYRDVLRPVSRLSLLSEETQEGDTAPLQYPLQIYTASQNAHPNFKEAEAILRRIEEYSGLLSREKDDLLRKSREEIEKEWREKQAELHKQRETVRKLLADINAEKGNSEPLHIQPCFLQYPSPASHPLRPLPTLFPPSNPPSPPYVSKTATSKNSSKPFVDPNPKQTKQHSMHCLPETSTC